MMKATRSVLSAMILVGIAAMAAAADISGSWTARFDTP
jgi:hypothetical protein